MDLPFSHQHRRVLQPILDVGIGSALSGVVHTRRQAMLGMITLAAPLIILSGYAVPAENMPHAIEVPGPPDSIRSMLVASGAVFLPAMPVNVGR